MSIRYCSFTGVDNHTSIPDMLALSHRYPFIEWGVLFSLTASTDVKDKRYPALEHILELNAVFAANPDVNAALHICGKAAYGVIDGSLDLSTYFKHFQRIQLNIISSRIKVDNLKNLINAYPDKTFMTQHNSANNQLAALLQDCPNHAVLFDASGGRGISPEIWPEHLTPKFCGYAGGLGPDNIEMQLQLINKSAGTHNIWIDMEGRLRTEEDIFSLEKCEKVAQAVAHFQALQKLSKPHF